MYMHVCLGIWRYMHICMCMVFNVYADLHIDKGTCIEFAHVYAYVHASIHAHACQGLGSGMRCHGCSLPHGSGGGQNLSDASLDKKWQTACFHCRRAPTTSCLLAPRSLPFSLRGGHLLAPRRTPGGSWMRRRVRSARSQLQLRLPILPMRSRDRARLCFTGRRQPCRRQAVAGGNLARPSQVAI